VRPADERNIQLRVLQQLEVLQLEQMIKPHISTSRAVASLE